MNSARLWLTGVFLALTLAACGERTAPPPSATPAPSITPPANTAAPATNASPSVVPPSTAEEVDAKKGTESGTVGGAAGTAGYDGQPRSGSAAGGGPSPAQPSGEPTENTRK